MNLSTNSFVEVNTMTIFVEERKFFMFKVQSYSTDREKNYETVIQQLAALLDGETNQIANLSNASALLNQFLERINWVGFIY